MKNNYFTLYWLNGEREIIYGPIIEHAFNAAGYDDSSIKTLAWYDNGITDSHYYDKIEKKWVKYEPLHIHAQDIKSYSEETLVEMFHKHHEIVVQFESKDELMLQQSIGCFAQIGWVKYLSITYGEWHKGNYGDDLGAEVEDAQYFMASGMQYYKPLDLMMAVSTLISRTMSQHPYRPFGNSDLLEDIKAAAEPNLY